MSPVFTLKLGGHSCLAGKRTIKMLVSDEGRHLDCLTGQVESD